MFRSLPCAELLKQPWVAWPVWAAFPFFAAAFVWRTLWEWRSGRLHSGKALAASR